MGVGEIHVGDTGTVFVFTIKDQDKKIVSLTGNTSVTIVFQQPKPNIAVFSREGILTTNGSDGKVQYTTDETDLTIPGQWQVQAFVENDDGAWNSDIYGFHVYPNLV